MVQGWKWVLFYYLKYILNICWMMLKQSFKNKYHENIAKVLKINSYNNLIFLLTPTIMVATSSPHLWPWGSSKLLWIKSTKLVLESSKRQIIN